jgi:rRNA maturation protein Nop10
MPEETIPVVKNSVVKATISQPTVVVKLPSGGYFYPETSPLSSGTVEIYQVTARHEDILSNTNFLKKGVVLDEFLKVLIATPGVSTNDFFLGDKNALYVEARKSAYGEIYPVKITCPKCGAVSDVDIDLNTLKNKEVPPHGPEVKHGFNKFTFVLPNSNKTITWGLLTHKDDADIDIELKKLSTLGMGAAPEITTRLKYVIKAVDGETDKGKIKNFIDTQLTARDSLALRRHIREYTPDVDMTFQFTCPECGHQEKTGIPLGAGFFWPTVNDA